MSRLDEDFGFVNLLFACRIRRASKIAYQKSLERDLSTPVKAFFLEMYSEPSNI